MTSNIILLYPNPEYLLGNPNAANSAYNKLDHTHEKITINFQT